MTAAEQRLRTAVDCLDQFDCAHLATVAVDLAAVLDCEVYVAARALGRAEIGYPRSLIRVSGYESAAEAEREVSGAAAIRWPVV